MEGTAQKMENNVLGSSSGDVNAYVGLSLSRFGRMDATSIHSADGASRALGKVDAELAELEAAVRMVLPQRNALVPIARLPPEVLALVFKVLSIESPPDNLRHTSLCQRLGWINVSHVSQHWRRVALENPSLWSGLVLVLGDNWLEESLSRVKEAAVHLDTVNSSFAPSMAQLERILKHQRIAEVRLRRVSHHSAPVKHFLSEPAPTLHTLELSSIEDSFIHQFTFPIPPTVFRQNAPNLRRVTLDRCRCAWSTLHPFQGLTELIMKQKPDSIPRNYSDDVGPSTWADFVHCLEQMPGLEVLIAEHCIPQVPPEFLPGTTRIPLSRLARLTLNGRVKDCLACLHTIDFPPSTKISVVCPSFPDTINDDAHSLFVLLKSHMIDFADDVGPPLSMTVNDKYGLTVTFYDFVKRHESKDPNLAPPILALYLQFQLNERREGRTGLSQSMDALDFMCETEFTATVLRSLQSLHVDGWSTLWTPEIFMDVFGRCQQVQHLSLTSFAALAGSKALSLPNPHSPPPPQASSSSGKRKPTKKQTMPFLFPHLDSLFFWRTEFDARQHYGREKGIFRTLFLRWLKARLAKDAGPNEVCIEMCTVRRVDVDKIREVVLDVRWDGQEEALSTEAQMDWMMWGMMGDSEDEDDEMDEDDMDFGPPFGMFQNLLAMAASA